MMDLGRFRTILFDLDGTLVDTAPDLAGAMNAVLGRDGRPHLPVAAVRAMVGRGAQVLIEKGFAATGASADPERLPGLVENFLDYYRLNLTANSVPFVGAREVVADFAAQGARLGVCTNKPFDLAEALLRELDFRSPFHSVRGADSAPYKKPDPRHVYDTLTLAGGSHGEAVLIGDSETDVKAARAAGIPVVLVSFGYTETPVTELGGDAIIDHFRDLPDALRALA